jgi:hypothetical protein
LHIVSTILQFVFLGWDAFVLYTVQPHCCVTFRSMPAHPHAPERLGTIMAEE